MRGAFWGVLLALALAAAAPARGQELPDRSPVLLSADEIVYDEERGIVVASGNVEISQNRRVLLADTVTYDQRAGTVKATGDVSLTEPDGSVLFSDYVELTEDLREGAITNIRILLQDRSRIAAAAGRRIGGNRSELDRVVFSPCELCPKDPTRAPLWQLKAVKVVHDQETHRIEYRDAWMEIFGVPILYTPYFSHPDPTVDRQSGFLAPTVGISDELGLFAQIPYFWAIAPDRDLTIAPLFTTEQSIVGVGEYRQRLAEGEFQIEASGTIADRQEIAGGVEVVKEDQFRGHVDAAGRFDIDQYWRWGFDVQRATDKTYLRLYDFSSARSLTSRVFAEGFHARNYLALRGYSFQGLRAEDENDEAPIVLPLIDYNFVGEPGRYGSYWTFDANAMVLSRLEGRESRRLSLRTAWVLPYVAPAGDIYTLTAAVQADAYSIEDVDPLSDDPNPSGPTESGFEGRLLPQLGFDWRYPLVRRHGSFSEVFEPMVGFVIGPDGGNPGAIPNEDSLDIEFDEANLFDLNRFPGRDRVDSGQRVNYGFQWSVYGDGGGSSSLFLGQSYRLDENDAFPTGSGLEDQLSDVVGRLQITPNEYLDLLYRFRFDVDDAAVRRSELGLQAGPPALNLGLSYAFLDDAGASAEFGRREEIAGTLRSQLTENWSTFVAARHDLENGITLSYGGGLAYQDECIELRASAVRSRFEDEEVDPDTRVLLTVVFKNLGEISGDF